MQAIWKENIYFQREQLAEYYASHWPQLSNNARQYGVITNDWELFLHKI